MSHSFHVVLVCVCTSFMLHFVVMLSFHGVLFPCHTSFSLRFSHVALFSCCPFSCCIISWCGSSQPQFLEFALSSYDALSMLQFSFHFAVFSCLTFFVWLSVRVNLFSCCTLFIMHFFVLHFYYVAFFYSYYSFYIHFIFTHSFHVALF